MCMCVCVCMRVHVRVRICMCMRASALLVELVRVEPAACVCVCLFVLGVVDALHVVVVWGVHAYPCINVAARILFVRASAGAAMTATSCAGVVGL